MKSEREQQAREGETKYSRRYFLEIVGAGAVVSRGEVPDYALMLGVPARRTGWVSRHGHVLKPGPSAVMVCPESGWRYQKTSGALKCLDYDEDRPLPTKGST